MEEWRAWHGGIGRGPESRGAEHGARNSGVLDRRPPAPLILSRWRLKKKLTHGVHTSVKGKKISRGVFVEYGYPIQIIHLTCGPIRLKDVHNGKDQVEEELQCQISE
jgi:hypothetical protein